MPKLSYEFIKSQIESKGYILVSEEYVNYKTKLEYICPIHNEKGIQKASWNYFQQGHGCKYCATDNNANRCRLSFEYVKNEMLKKGLILLENEYKNNHTLMNYKCSIHPDVIQHINWNSIQSGAGCSFCANENRSKKQRKPFIEVKEMFNNLGYTLISSEYLNGRTPLRFICEIHKGEGIQNIRLSDLQKGTRCKYCTKERIQNERKLSYEYVYDFFLSKGLVLLSEEYINAQKKLKYYCKNHPDIIQESTYADVYSRKECCKFCANDARRGENCNLWKGGITPLHTHLRDKIGTWKKDSAKLYGYKCIVTGDEKFIIHHLFSFSDILKETMKDLDIPIRNKIIEYSDDELRLIENHFLTMHYDYPLGVPLSHDVHEEFHNIYGKGNNTPHQFIEFMKNKGIEFKPLNFEGAA